MKIEQNDPSLILSQTILSDVFFTEYLSQASGNFVKVYLYLFFLSKYNKDIKLNDVAKKLELQTKDVQDAISYWESVGLIIKKPSGFIMVNLQELELSKIYKPKVTMSADHIKEAGESKNRAAAIEAINNRCFQGVMSPSWYGDIDLWFKKFGFDEQVMIALFEYCFNKSALHRNYVLTVADAWSKNNIKTYSDLETYFKKTEKLKVMCTTIKRKLRLSRNLSVYEEAYVEKWHITYGYDMQIIEIALMQTSSKYSFSFEYIDKILTDWYKKGLKTGPQIENYIAENKNNKSNRETESYKKKRSDFLQRSYTDEELNKLYVNT